MRYAPSTDDRVQAIQRMFDLCVQGYGFKSIAERFNEEGIPTMFGSKWNMSNIAQMLRSPVYRGALVYNKRTSGSLFGMDADGKLRPKKGRSGTLGHSIARRNSGNRPRSQARHLLPATGCGLLQLEELRVGSCRLFRSD